MRKKKNRDSRLDACREYRIDLPEENPFGGKHPLDLEIGCGKGNFACEMANKNPDRYFIAVELSTDAIITALEKAKSENIPNLLFINANAEQIPEYFDKNSVDTIYLNFSDPWPKAKHSKRRLTYRKFLKIYADILAEHGRLCFKTDNDALFDFTIAELNDCGWKIENLTYDLHNSGFAADNVMTEYEKNFSEKGFTIKRLEAYPPSIRVYSEGEQ